MPRTPGVFRSLRTAIARSAFDIPRAATHVLYWQPPLAGSLSPAGWWDLTGLGHFLAGTDDTMAAGIGGPAEMPEDELAAFTEAEFGESVRLDRFGHDAAPGYWITVAP